MPGRKRLGTGVWGCFGVLLTSWTHPRPSFLWGTMLTVSSELEEVEEEIARRRVRQSLGFLFYLSQKHRIERRGWTCFQYAVSCHRELGVQRPPVALANGRLTQAGLGFKALKREKLAMAAPCSTSPASISFLCITPASLGLEQNPGNHFHKHTMGGSVC